MAEEVQGRNLDVEALVGRADALDVLEDGPLRIPELGEELGVSRSTVHRLKNELAEQGVLQRSEGGLQLTRTGTFVASAVRDLRDTVEACARIRPLLDVAEDLPPGFDPAWFRGAEVTEPHPTDPYRPTQRFVELVQEAGTLRGYDTISLAPFAVDDIYEAILSGLETQVVFLPEVGRRMARNYPDRFAEVHEEGDVEVRVHGDLPCGLAVFDDRMSLGGYDAETGAHEAYVDTDDPRALEWGRAEFRRVWDEAKPLDPSDLDL